MSAKNLLQEFCQERKIPLPKYTTEKLESPAHLPEFISQVEIDGMKYHSDKSYSSKRAAELSVAGVALASIQTKTEENKKIYQGESVAILVDLENQPSIVDKLVQKVNLNESNLEILVFVSGNSHLIDKEWESKKIIKCMIPSVRSDAADTYMIFKVGQLVQQKAYTKFIIVSRDHFAKTLEEILILEKVIALMECKVENILRSLV